MKRIFHIAIRIVPALMLLVFAAVPGAQGGWSEDEFERRPLYAYPLPHGKDDIIGNLITYQIQKGDTLLDVGRWFGVTAKEISNANGKIDWWSPPVGKQIVLPDEHILPDGPRVGIVLNIPEMRLYYYYPSPTGPPPHRKGKLTPASFVPAKYVPGKSAPGKSAKSASKKHAGASGASVVYTFPVGLGRFDWKTPIGEFTVRGKTKNPTWVVPQDIYEEHLERDGEAEHVVSGDDPDNPLGHYRIELTLPEYALHGTNVPWGVGMEVSHGCIRLYPEDIERLFNKVKIGTPGAFVYQPVKFGWRGDALYVEVHDDLYGRYAGLWAYAQKEADRLNLTDQIDSVKLEKAVEAKTGVPTYVMPGPAPGSES
ncbi:MAG TPA: L,D-transpeptidase family protein [Candidatus Acidoferrales bacterium]|nr:L,D-transpeptidase family protein [Candidatus Acidoferrales bacterium]